MSETGRPILSDVSHPLDKSQKTKQNMQVDNESSLIRPIFTFLVFGGELQLGRGTRGGVG